MITRGAAAASADSKSKGGGAPAAAVAAPAAAAVARKAAATKASKAPRKPALQARPRAARSGGSTGGTDTPVSAPILPPVPAPAPSAAPLKPAPRPWPRDVSTRVIPRVEPPYTLAEDVFSLPLGALNGVLSCLKLDDASQLRLVCRDAEAHVAAYTWADTSTPVRNLTHWRAAFPRAVALKLKPYGPTPDLRLFSGLTALNLSGCDLSALRRAGLDAALAGTTDVCLLDCEPVDLIAVLLSATAPPCLARAAEGALVYAHRFEVGHGERRAVVGALRKPALPVARAVLFCDVLGRFLGCSRRGWEDPDEEPADSQIYNAVIAALERFPREEPLQAAGLSALLKVVAYVKDNQCRYDDYDDDDYGSGGGDGWGAFFYAFDRAYDEDRLFGGGRRRQRLRHDIHAGVVLGVSTIQVAVDALIAHGAASPAIVKDAAELLRLAAARRMDEEAASQALQALLPALEAQASVPSAVSTVVYTVTALLQRISDGGALTAGGFPCVLAAMRTMLRDPAAHAQALGAAASVLNKLVSRTLPASAAAFVEAGGLELLTAALRASALVGALFKPSTQLLHTLSQEPALQPQLAAAGIVAAVIAALVATAASVDADALDEVGAVLSELDKCAAGAAAIDAPDGLQALVDAVYRPRIDEEEVQYLLLRLAEKDPRRLQAIAAAHVARIAQWSAPCFHFKNCERSITNLWLLEGDTKAAPAAIVAAQPARALTAALRAAAAVHVWSDHDAELCNKALRVLVTVARASLEEGKAAVAAGVVGAVATAVKRDNNENELGSTAFTLLNVLLENGALSPAAAAEAGVLGALSVVLRDSDLWSESIMQASAALRRLIASPLVGAGRAVEAGAVAALLHALKVCTRGAEPSRYGAEVALETLLEVVRAVAAGAARKAALAAIEENAPLIVLAVSMHTAVGKLVAPACGLLSVLVREGGAGVLAALARAGAVRAVAAAVEAHAASAAVAEPACEVLLSLYSVRDASEAQELVDAGVPRALAAALPGGALSGALQMSWSDKLMLWDEKWPVLAKAVAAACELKKAAKRDSSGEGGTKAVDGGGGGGAGGSGKGP